MINVKLVIKSGRLQRNEMVQVNLVCKDYRSTLSEISTEIVIETQHWVPPFKNVKKSAPYNDIINRESVAQKAKLKPVIKAQKLSRVGCSFEQLKSLYSNEPKEILEQNSFIDALDNWIVRSKTKVSTNTIKDYQALRKHLNEFEKHRERRITFSQIDFGFYEDFVDYLENVPVKRDGRVGLVKSSVGKVIKNLKIFLRNAMRRKICPFIDLEGFKVFRETGDHIYLDDAEIEKIADYDFSANKRLDLVRDMLVVGCETGLRFSDFSNLNKHSIQRPVIKTKTRKTMTPVVIPISNKLDKILRKYNDCLPGIRNRNVFNTLMKTVVKEAGITEMVQVMHLQGNKKIEEWVPKYNLVSSHTCRRSFCTNAYKKGLPTVVIRGISGHADDKTLFRYIKISPLEAVEATLKRMKEMPEFTVYFMASDNPNKTKFDI